MALARALLDQVPQSTALLAMVAVTTLVGALALVAGVVWLSRAVAGVFLLHEDRAAVAHWIVWGILAGLVRAGMLWASRAAAAELAFRTKRALRERLVGHIVAAGPVFHDEHDTGAAVQTVVEAVDALGALVGGYLPDMLTAAVVPLVVLVAVAAQFWIGGLILLVTAPLIPVFMVLIGRAAEARTERQWQALTRLGGHFLDVLGGLPTLILFHQTARQHDIIQRVSDDYRRTVMATLRLALMSALVLELFAALSLALVAVAVGLSLLHGRVLFAPALAVLILAPEFYLPQRALGGAFHRAMESVTAGRAVDGLLAVPVGTVRGGSRILAGSRARALDLDAVTLQYPGRPPVLADWTLHVEPGERLALVGPSGSGKTSVIHALLGYRRVASGQVRVDRIPLEQLDLAWWRSRVGYVGQWPYLGFATIRDNLRHARPEADDRALWAALDQAQLAEFVTRLPLGLDTPVGDRGLSLSGGQAARLALARLFLRDVDTVMLDEPTEQLDPATRERVWDGLERFVQGRTMILVTHRREEAARAQRVVALVGPAAEPASEVAPG